MSDTEKKDDQKKKSKLKAVQEEFVGFLWEFSVVGLAVGVIIGGAVNSLVQSFVTGIITPFIQLIIPSQAFKDLNYTYHGVTFAFGPLISATLNFLIVASIIFFTVKYLLLKGGKIEKTKLGRD